MGVSTDAILLFGIMFDDEGPIWETGENPDEHDWESVLDVRLGIAHLNYAARDEHRKKIGVELVRHCHDNCPMWAVAIIESVITASRGNPERVSTFATENSVVLQTWIHRLHEFCRLMHIELPEDAQPGWYICSDSDF